MFCNFHFDHELKVVLKQKEITTNYCQLLLCCASPVVWNPWVEKAAAMGDFDDLGYKEMVCVEAGTKSPH